jgi:hypothetical protein
MNGIPRVREWKITVEGGADGRRHTFCVLAPTRRLALLNLRHVGIWGPLVSIGAARNEIGQRELVADWDDAR